MTVTYVPYSLDRGLLNSVASDAQAVDAPHSRVFPSTSPHGGGKLPFFDCLDLYHNPPDSIPSLLVSSLELSDTQVYEP